jgi:hypothetical protein
MQSWQVRVDFENLLPVPTKLQVERQHATSSLAGLANLELGFERTAKHGNMPARCYTVASVINILLIEHCICKNVLELQVHVRLL